MICQTSQADHWFVVRVDRRRETSHRSGLPDSLIHVSSDLSLASLQVITFVDEGVENFRFEIELVVTRLTTIEKKLENAYLELNMLEINSIVYHPSIG